jgi:uncharacterized protein (UPF0333 family)
MKGNVLAVSIGVVMGLFIGGGVTWYLTYDFVNNAVIEAELKFNELLETEKSKYQNDLTQVTKIKENLEYNLVSAELVIDSLNTTIDTRSKELNKLKKEYDQQISSINGMSHNELTDFFATRYGN